MKETKKYNIDEKEYIEAKLLICKSGDLLLARRSQRLRRAGVAPEGTIVYKELDAMANVIGTFVP